MSAFFARSSGLPAGRAALPPKPKELSAAAVGSRFHERLIEEPASRAEPEARRAKVGTRVRDVPADETPC